MACWVPEHFLQLAKHGKHFPSLFAEYPDWQTVQTLELSQASQKSGHPLTQVLLLEAKKYP